MPKWRDAEAVILHYVAQRRLGEGEKLPSDREFAVMAGCSLQPIVKAMESLSRKGLVHRRRGAATIVVSPQPVVCNPASQAGIGKIRAAKATLLDQSEFSFTRSATQTYGYALRSKIMEATRRLPLPANGHEKKAQSVLGLKAREPFYVIARLRLLDEVPRAIHRSYLNPKHFPPTFLVDYDFATESLIDLFNRSGLRIEARYTTLRARFPTDMERSILSIGQMPILEAEQELDAVHLTSNALIKLEFMLASYVGWEYQIANRRPNTHASKDASR